MRLCSVFLERIVKPLAPVDIMNEIPATVPLCISAQKNKTATARELTHKVTLTAHENACSDVVGKYMNLYHNN